MFTFFRQTTQTRNPIHVDRKLRVCSYFHTYIWMMGYFRLSKVRVKECPVRLEPAAGAKNRRTTTVKIQRNQQLLFHFIKRHYHMINDVNSQNEKHSARDNLENKFENIHK